MKKNIIIIEEDDLNEIEKVRRLLEVNNIDFNYYPAMDQEVFNQTKSYFQSLMDKLKW